MDIESVDKASTKSDGNCADSVTKTTTSAATTSPPPRNHACEIEVTFLTNLQAEQALQILQVDREPTDRVSKSFHLVKKEEDDTQKTGGNDTICKLKV